MKVADKSTTSTLDAARLARGWRPVCIEQYAEGLRLVATDSYRLLVTWVTAQGFASAEEPPLDELPAAQAVAVDQWGRAKNLLAYMGQQAAKEENDGLFALVRLGVPWQAPDSTKTELQFHGLNALAVDIEYPDNERLQLPVYEGPFPDWRPTLHDHRGHRTTALRLQADAIEIIGKATKPFGEECHVDLTFGGENKPVAIAFGDDPRVRGLLMPLRWDFEANAPAEPVEP